MGMGMGMGMRKRMAMVGWGRKKCREKKGNEKSVGAPAAVAGGPTMAPRNGLATGNLFKSKRVR